MCMRYNITKDHSLGHTLLDLCMSRESLQYFPKCCEYECLMLASYTFKTTKQLCIKTSSIALNGIIVDGVFPVIGVCVDDRLCYHALLLLL